MLLGRLNETTPAAGGLRGSSGWQKEVIQNLRLAVLGISDFYSAIVDRWRLRMVAQGHSHRLLGSSPHEVEAPQVSFPQRLLIGGREGLRDFTN